MASSLVIFYSLVVFAKIAKGMEPPLFLINNFCLTPQCKEIGAKMDYCLNKSSRPCEDFYEFSCGGWISKTVQPPSEPLWSRWQAINEIITQRMHAMLLLNADNGGGAYEKARRVYKACLSAEKSEEEKSVEHLRGLIRENGGWPLVEKGSNSDRWNGENFDWVMQIAKITRNFGVHALFKVFPGIDYKNTKKYMLYIQNGDFILPRSILLHPEKHLKELNSYKIWICQTLKYLYRNVTTKSVKSDVVKMINFEIKLSKLSLLTGKHERLHIKDFSEITKYNWTKIIAEFVPELTKNDSDIIDVNSKRYFTKLFNLVTNTSKNTVANYIIWSLVKDLSRDTTTFMRNLNFIMDSLILGVKSDISRKQECTEKINAYLSLAVVPKYMNLFLHPDTLTKVDQMVHNIKVQFIKILEENTWLSQETKRNAVEKIAALKHLVGYPEFVKNTTFLDGYYEELKIGDQHFLNVISMKQFLQKQEFSKLLSEVNTFQWPSSPLEVNAYYSVLQNVIIVPLGVLEPPFFHVDYPEVFNYGALGTLIGHEIAHALDTTGREADRNGQLVKWWPDSDIKNYQNKVRCFEKQYGNLGVNGLHTIGENIADNVGLQISLSAFKKLRSSKLHVIVPELELFTNEQLYFISFAQLWCETSSIKSSINEDEHSPVKQRVLGSVMNNKDFENAFQCRNNNFTKCTLW